MKIAQKLVNLIFPSPRSNGKFSDSHRSDLPANQANNDSETPSRCQFTFSDGRRCRSEHVQLCAHHASKNQSNSPDLMELEPLCADLTTATNINRALAQVYLLMAQGRIPQKQAVAFGYLSQLLP